MGAGQHTDAVNERLRALPSVERLARQLLEQSPVPPARPDGAVPSLATHVARNTLEARRAELLAGEDGEVDLLERARAALAAAGRPSLRAVINATGVIVHTNLGRAPLAPAALEAVGRTGGSYSNLELDLASGQRGSRQHHLEALLCELTGAQAAIVVNNCAGATLLAAATLAGPGRAIVVSRGQLIEIGGSFRLPEVIGLSGSHLVEVGTSNRTRASDYAQAIASTGHAPVGAILRAHPSNFRALGFVEEASIEELCRLGVAVIDDVGSGVLIEGIPALADEPAVPRSVRAGAALVCFSGDKLLGGPQAGIMVGTRDAVARARRHPLARALRVDKLSLAALEATLRLYREPERACRELPVLVALQTPSAVLAARAARLADQLAAGGVPAKTVEAVARVGGGALPLLELRGPAVAVDAAGGAQALAAALRVGEPPVVGRISDGRLLLDPRTIREHELDSVTACVLAATRG